MEALVIPILSNSSEDSVWTSTALIILFGMIPTSIPTTVPIVYPPVISTLLHTSPFLYTDSSDSDTFERPPSYPPDHSLSNYLSLDDSYSDSPLDLLSGYSSDTLSSHSIPDSPFDTSATIYARPSHKRCRSSTTLLPIATPVSRALSLVRADLLPPRKRISVATGETDVRFEVGIETVAEAEAIERLRQLNEGMKGELETLEDGDLHDEDKGLSIMTITRSGMTLEAIEELISQRVKEVVTAQETNRNAGLIDGNQSQNGDDNNKISGRNGNHGNNNGDVNKNGGNGGAKRNAPVARVYTYKHFLNCQPCNFRSTKGVVSLARWFDKMESVFRISNHPPNSQVKLATSTLLDGALTWWNSHVQTISIVEAYEMPWKDLMNDVLSYSVPDRVEFLDKDYYCWLKTYCCSCKLKLLDDAADIKLRLVEQSAVVGIR
nr:hypothetical protein [Tanacetum cinerariifolium]